MAKDRTKEILKEIKSLRKELSSRLDALEARMDAGSRKDPVSSSAPAAPSLPALPDPGAGSDSTTVKRSLSGFQQPTEREISVVVQPLHDLSLARVVEQALADTEGVESSNLRELRGDSAVIDAKVDDGVSLISSLRRKLPVAFDVTDSDKGSFTIALAQPAAERADGVAGHESL